MYSLTLSARRVCRFVKDRTSSHLTAGFLIAFGSFVLLAASPQTQPATPGPPALSNSESQPYSNLTFEPIGIGDLLFVYVANAADSTRSVRVSADGTVTIPFLKDPIKVAGLLATDVEKLIAAAFRANKILVDPLVSVSVLEYRSKPVSIVGAVRQPLSFQAIGNLHLLDAIAKANGLAPEAGSHIIVSTPVRGAVDQVQDISVPALMSGTDPSLNVLLEGGEEIRVPSAGRIYVVGNVKAAGVFPIPDGEEMTVLKALALSQGALSFSQRDAIVYRSNTLLSKRQEISIPLRQIQKHQAPDVRLEPNDIFYVPDNSGRRLTAEVVDRILLFSGATASGLLIYRNR